MTPAELDALERAFAIAARAENERDPSARNRRYEAEDLITSHAEALLAMARRTEAAEGQLDGILDLLSSQGQTTLVAGIRANMKAKS